jgi:GTP-binding protein
MTSETATLVALIGRPNVGKSTLFNRMTKRRDAIVDPTPGVTRDRHYAQVSLGEKAFILVDTGGIEDEDDTITNHIRRQAMMAVDEADIILFIMDGREGLTPSDFEIVDLLRRTEKQVFFIVNKIDGPEMEIDLLSPFWELGVEKLWALSADHKFGYQTLVEALEQQLPEETPELDLPEGTVRLSFLGRPNVGKSSMINAIMGQERMVVSEIGKGKTKDKLEKFSILKALGSLTRCDIALVLIDAGEGITEQDTKVLGYTQDHGRACIILVNKWDLLKGDTKRQKQLMEEITRATTFMSFAPVLKVSALTGQGIKRIFPEIGRVYRQFNERFPTSALNQLLEDAVSRHNPPFHHGRRLKFFYTAQIKTAPPTFAIIANSPKGVHFSYQRYLVNHFRDSLGLDSVPVRVFLREKKKRGKK